MQSPCRSGCRAKYMSHESCATEGQAYTGFLKDVYFEVCILKLNMCQQHCPT